MSKQLGYSEPPPLWFFNCRTNKVEKIAGDTDVLTIGTFGIGWGKERMCYLEVVLDVNIDGESQVVEFDSENEVNLRRLMLIL